MPPENEWSEDETSNLGCLFFRGKLLVSEKLTPPKINMEPKNEGFEDAFSFQFGEL